MKETFELPIANLLSGNLLLDAVSTSGNIDPDVDQGGAED